MNGAILSDCKRYRYRLWRDVPGGITGRALFIMLNPSTATAEVDDPTVKRCTGFAQRYGFLRYDVVNLFSYRSAEPTRLCSGDVQPFGPDHDPHVTAAINDADIIICAWGADKLVQGTTFANDMVARVKRLGKTPLCLGQTIGGHPRHPLYLKGDTEIVAL